jgi:L-lactate dehydrogenase complex protein LldF
MPKDYAPLKKKITAALNSPERGKTLLIAVKRGRDARRDQLTTLENPEGFRDGIKEIKTSSIANLDSLLATFMENCRRNRNKVLVAKDGQEVVDYILDLAVKNNVTLIEKSKSLTTEEIELNHRLLEGKKDLTVVETDLGERIIQLVNEKPYHLVFPAIHKTQGEVAEIFTEATGTPVPNDLPAIMNAVRKHLRPVFLNSQLGITGANIAVAETGSIIVETNEGNARLVSAVPDIHVVVVGMEKIISTWDEALELVMAHPISATGTRLTNYVSIVTERLPLGDKKAREFHVIILDNGRTKMRQDPWLKEGLNCIRCGACMNACPTYGVVGGHTFGYIYPGPIGIPWTEEVHGLDKAAEFAHLCISCGLCKEICPADIDIPMMIAKVKEEDVEKNGQLTPNKILSQSDDFARIASATAPLSNWVIQNRISRSFMDRFLGIEQKRKLPRFERKTFAKRFAAIKQAVPNPRSKVVYFVDLVANYNEPKLGVRAVELLQKSRIEVTFEPHLKPSGMPYISYGELKKARRIAEWNVNLLSDYVKRGYDVVATEPTAVYCLKFAYPKLLDNSEQSRSVANRSYEYFEYLEKNCQPLHLRPANKAPSVEATIGFHIPCHQRALSSGKFTIAALENAGYKVKIIETGTCCGMAGTFGLKKGPLGYELSMAVGKPLFDLFNNESPAIKTIATESSVCTIQLEDGTKCELVHPLNLLSN